MPKEPKAATLQAETIGLIGERHRTEQTREERNADTVMRMANVLCVPSDGHHGDAVVKTLLDALRLKAPSLFDPYANETSNAKMKARFESLADTLGELTHTFGQECLKAMQRRTEIEHSAQRNVYKA